MLSSCSRVLYCAAKSGGQALPRVLDTESRVLCCSLQTLHTSTSLTYYDNGGRPHNNYYDKRSGKNNRHNLAKFRRARAQKVIKVHLPETTQPNYNDQTPHDRRMNIRDKGILPPRKWQEVPMNISASGLIFEPYVPVEGDGKASLWDIKEKGQEVAGKVFQGGKTYRAIKKIKSLDKDFKKDEFASAAQDIYIKAHELLAERNTVELHKYATEYIFPLMMTNVKNKTIRWKFLKSVEFPRVVHARVEDMLGKDNKYAQVTVRHHTQQVLAVYDRFGRLEHGSEVVAKDVLEYVVYENHISNVYGQWRMHGKIIPTWVPPRDPVLKTFIKPLLQEVPALPESVEKKAEDKDEESPPQIKGAEGESPRQLAA